MRFQDARIKVLQISTSLSSHDGLAETLRLLCRRLSPGSFQLGICTITDRDSDILAAFRELPIEIFTLNRRGFFFDPLTTLSVRGIIREFRPDIVHTHNNKGNFHGRLAAVGTRSAIVTTHHDSGDIIYARTPSLKQRASFDAMDVHDVHHPTFVETRIYPFLNLALNRLNTKVISVSDAVGRIHTRDLHHERFETVHAPYDDEIFSHRCAGQGDSIVLGTVARLTRVKGHSTLLKAMRLLNEVSDSKIKLRIIGEGPLRSEIEAFIRANDLESVVRLCGHLPHDEKLYEGIDIYLQPSLSEGSSITLLEAMACSIPVIASDIEGPKELIVNQESGLLVPTKDPEALAAAIQDLINDPERARRLGQKGSERAQSLFSAEVFAERMTRIYRNILSKSGP